MTTILVAADAEWVRNQVRAAFVSSDSRVVEVTALKRPKDLLDVVRAEQPDLIILDLQIGNMGGIAGAIELRLESAAGRLPDQRILLLLDREADRFLAQRAAADDELVKPIDAGTLRRAAKRALAERPPAESPDPSPAPDPSPEVAAVEA
jgi:DNA-binding response OmpR family regulator